MVVLGTLGVDGGSLVGPSSLVNDGVIRASLGATFSRSDALSGAGGWRADGGTLQFVNNVVSTEGVIAVVNGGALQLANATLTGSNRHSDADRGISVNSVLELSGSLLLEKAQESAFAWGANATLRLTGGQGADLGAWEGWESIEFGGVDLGIDPEAFVGAVAGFSNDFDLTRLELGAGARLFLVDRFDNGNRDGPFGEVEARYVDTLVFLDILAARNHEQSLIEQRLFGSQAGAVEDEVGHLGER